MESLCGEMTSGVCLQAVGDHHGLTVAGPHRAAEQARALRRAAGRQLRVRLGRYLDDHLTRML